MLPVSLDGCEPRTVELLHFGLRTPAGVVDDAQWRAFVREEISTRFPEGLTVLHADGRWRSADGTTVDEPSRVVELVHRDDPAARAAVSEIVARYKARFAQQSVLRVRQRGEVCF